MSAAAAVDTLKAARDLQEAGVDPKQAETIANLLCAVHGDLAMKTDLETLEARLEGKINPAVIKAMLGGAVIATALFSVMQWTG